MKKSLLALGAACVALSGMAAAPLQKLQAPAKPMFDRSAELKTDAKIRLDRPASSLKKAPAKVSSADVITSVTGTTQNMTATASGYYVNLFYIMQYVDQSVASQVVYGDNDEVYFYDIIPFTGSEAYVKGVKKGDKIEVSLPQTVLYMEDYGYGLQLSLLDEMVVEEDGEEYLDYVPSDATVATFSVAEDGSMVADLDGKMLGYTYTDDNSWSYYGVTDLSMVPFNEKFVELPADYEVSESFWYVDAGDYGYGVNWAQGYDEVYLQGLWSGMPDAWIKGTVEYNDDTTATISIAQDQLIGIYGGTYYIFTKCAKLEFDEAGELDSAELMPADYQYQLIWDFEENTLVSKDQDVSFVFNAAKDRFYYATYFTELKLIHQDDFEGTPVNPYDLKYSADNFDYYGCYEFYFTVPAVSTEGYFLDTDCLSYVIYVDGEEWEFEPGEEYAVPESMVEIPWDMTCYGIWNVGVATREVDFYVEGVSTIGVQSVYNYNGEETRSEIVTIDVDDPTAVSNVNADKKVASVKFYDVAGREVTNSAAGVVIKRVVYEDGSVASFKKVVR